MNVISLKLHYLRSAIISILHQTKPFFIADEYTVIFVRHPKNRVLKKILNKGKNKRFFCSCWGCSMKDKSYIMGFFYVICNTYLILHALRYSIRVSIFNISYKITIIVGVNLTYALHRLKIKNNRKLKFILDFKLYWDYLMSFGDYLVAFVWYYLDSFYKIVKIISNTKFAIFFSKILKFFYIKFVKKVFIFITKILFTKQYLYILYRRVKTFILALALALFFFIYLNITLKVSFLQHLAAWIIVGNIFFWLMSGFNFFIKRGRFGKFTSALQRFWKRAFTAFWAIEGFLFCLFFYYFLNASQEPLYMFDRVNLLNDFTLNLQSGFFNTFLLSVILYGCQALTLLLSNKRVNQAIVLVIILSFGVFYLFYLESYQVYYILTAFNDLNWIFNEETNSWTIELESIKVRTKHYYFTLCVIAKFWHFIFIFFAWLFFLAKTLETKTITFALLGFNYQNLLILFVLNLLCYCNWVKFVFRRFFDLPYYWFFFNPDQKNLRIIAHEGLQIILSCLQITVREIQFNDLLKLIWSDMISILHV